MGKGVKPTDTQRKILQNVQAGLPWHAGQPPGMSASGGWDSSYRSCYRHGWLNPEASDRGSITDAGRAAIAAKPQKEPT